MNIDYLSCNTALYEGNYLVEAEQALVVLQNRLEIPYRTQAKYTRLIRSPLPQWIDGLPSYIKACCLVRPAKVQFLTARSAYLQYSATEGMNEFLLIALSKAGYCVDKIKFYGS